MLLCLQILHSIVTTLKWPCPQTHFSITEFHSVCKSPKMSHTNLSRRLNLLVKHLFFYVAMATHHRYKSHLHSNDSPAQQSVQSYGLTPNAKNKTVTWKTSPPMVLVTSDRCCNSFCCKICTLKGG